MDVKDAIRRYVNSKQAEMKKARKNIPNIRDIKNFRKNMIHKAVNIKPETVKFANRAWYFNVKNRISENKEHHLNNRKINRMEVSKPNNDYFVYAALALSMNKILRKNSKGKLFTITKMEQLGLLDPRMVRSFNKVANGSPTKHNRKMKRLIAKREHKYSKEFSVVDHRYTKRHTVIPHPELVRSAILLEFVYAADKRIDRNATDGRRMQTNKMLKKIAKDPAYTKAYNKLSLRDKRNLFKTRIEPSKADYKNLNKYKHYERVRNFYNRHIKKTALPRMHRAHYRPLKGRIILNGNKSIDSNPVVRRLNMSAGITKNNAWISRHSRALAKLGYSPKGTKKRILHEVMVDSLSNPHDETKKNIEAMTFYHYNEKLPSEGYKDDYPGMGTEERYDHNAHKFGKNWTNDADRLNKTFPNAKGRFKYHRSYEWVAGTSLMLQRNSGLSEADSIRQISDIIHDRSNGKFNTKEYRTALNQFKKDTDDYNQRQHQDQNENQEDVNMQKAGIEHVGEHDNPAENKDNEDQNDYNGDDKSDDEPEF